MGFKEAYHTIRAAGSVARTQMQIAKEFSKIEYFEDDGKQYFLASDISKRKKVLLQTVQLLQLDNESAKKVTDSINLLFAGVE